MRLKVNDPSLHLRVGNPGGGGQEYNITITAGEHGTAEAYANASPPSAITKASAGDVVIVVWSADSGYAIEDVWVECPTLVVAGQTGAEFIPSKGSGSYAYFIMPAADVSVGASFMPVA